MIEILKHTVEYQNWGANAITFCFLATVFFTLLQGWSLFKQAATIRMRRSGESLSIAYFSYLYCYFFMFLIYGIGKNSIAMAFNGCLWVSCLAVMNELHRFEIFTNIHRSLIVMFSLMIPAVYFLRGVAQDVFVFAGLFGTLVPLAGQVRKMYQTKAPGSVEPKFIITFMCTNVFWFVYGFTTSNWIFLAFNPISFVVLTTALILYRRYKTRVALS